jgi:hypothetical protein
MTSKRRPSNPSAATPVAWSATRQGKRELIAAGLFVLAFAAVPLLRTELYPFSRAPMFADAPREYCEYSVSLIDGQLLDPIDFGLQRNYWGNPLGPGVGFEPPPSLDVFGGVPPSDREVEEWLDERLAHFPQIESVVVIQKRIGPVDRMRVDVTKLASQVVRNPHYRGPEQ